MAGESNIAGATRPRERLATSTTNLGRITRSRVVAAPRERVVHRALPLVDLGPQAVDHHLEHGVDVVRGPRRHPKSVEHCQRDLCVSPWLRLLDGVGLTPKIDDFHTDRHGNRERHQPK